METIKFKFEELKVCATIAKRQNYITNQQEIDIRKKLEELSKMISSLQKYLKTNTKN